MGKASGYAWLGMNVEGIANYLGLRMLMGIIRVPSQRLYWRRNSVYENMRFIQTMTTKQFLVISKYFHAYNSKAVPEDN